MNQQGDKDSSQDKKAEYDFINLVKGYHDLTVQDPKNKTTPEDYFQGKSEKLKKDKSAQHEKYEQVEIVCNTMYGLNKLDDAVDKISTIQDQFTDLKIKNANLVEFESHQHETLNDSRRYLMNYLFLFHLANIQRMPDELYKKLKSGKNDEIQNANEIIKSFVLLYEKHPIMNVDKIINNQKLIKAAEDLILAFDVNTQFNAKSIDSRKQMQQNIENSINATAFLMNYYFLFNLSQNGTKDPFDEFGIFLFTWKEKISKISGNVVNGEAPLFTSEIETYLRAKFILNLIDPKNNNFSQKLAPNILGPNNDSNIIEDELQTRFSKVEKDVINSFYYVHDHTFSGSFFNNYTIDIDQIKISYENDKFENISFLTIAFIIEIEKYIKSIINDLQLKTNIDNIISIIVNVPIIEFKTVIANDVSNILLYYFDKNNLEPSMMLDKLFHILFVVFSKYYDMVPENSFDPNAVIICICNVCQLLPYIRSAWSNYLFDEFTNEKNRNSDIIYNQRTKLHNIIGALALTKIISPSSNNSNTTSNTNNEYYEKFQSSLEFLQEDNIFSEIIDSFACIVVQRYIEIQDSLAINSNLLDLIIRTIEILKSKELKQRTKNMIEWVSEDIKSKK